MILGCLLLVLVLNRYDFTTKVSVVTPAPNPAVALAMVGDLGRIDTLSS